MQSRKYASSFTNRKLAHERRYRSRAATRSNPITLQNGFRKRGRFLWRASREWWTFLSSRMPRNGVPMPLPGLHCSLNTTRSCITCASNACPSLTLTSRRWSKDVARVCRSWNSKNVVDSAPSAFNPLLKHAGKTPIAQSSSSSWGAAAASSSSRSLLQEWILLLLPPLLYRNLRALSFAESEVEHRRLQEEGTATATGSSSTHWLSMLVERAGSLQFLDMTLVEIQDLDIGVLLKLATRCHTLRICESMDTDQILPFLKACTSSVRSLGMGFKP